MLQNKKSRKLINTKYLFANFSDFSEITNEVRQQNSERIFTGGVRINRSMYRTKNETEQYIKESLERKLP